MHPRHRQRILSLMRSHVDTPARPKGSKTRCNVEPDLEKDEISVVSAVRPRKHGPSRTNPLDPRTVTRAADDPRRSPVWPPTGALRQRAAQNAGDRRVAHPIRRRMASEAPSPARSRGLSPEPSPELSPRAVRPADDDVHGTTAHGPERQGAPARRPRKSMGPTRVAVVGAGYIADFHLEVLKGTPDVELTAVCDVDTRRAEAAARKFGAQRAVAHLADLPALGIEVAHLAVPPDLHVALTRELLELGIGVFVEKPLALATDDARALAALAEARGLPLGVNHNNVFHPAFRRLLARLEQGEIGRVEHVQVTLSVPLRQLDAGDFTHWMFRAPRNIVFEQAVHPLSQLQHLLGRVRSAATTKLGTRELHPGQVFHDRWCTAFTAERGTAQLYLAFGQPFTRSTLQVIGSDGSLEADLFHDHVAGERKTLYLDFWNSYLAGARRARQLKRDARSVLFGWSRFTLGIGARKDAFYVGMRDSIRAFHAALRAGEAPPNDAHTAVQVTEWADALAGDTPATPPPAPTFPEPGAARSGEVVVLGGTGFIGRRVVERLVARAVPVTCVVRRTHSLPQSIVDAALAGHVRLVRASLGDDGGMARALAGAERCIHLATGNGATWEEVERVMVQGSAQVAEQCADAGVKRLVYVSSIAALYTGTDGKRTEGARSGVIHDGWDTDPEPEARPLYARGKAAAERAVKAACERRGLGLVVARPGVVLGEGTPMQHSGLGLWVRDNHCVGWGLGDNPLPLVLADDVADALVAAAIAPGSGVDGKALNLCANPGLSGSEVVAELRRATGRALSFHPRRMWVSQAAEIGKWLVKRAGGRKAPFPSYRDLKSRALQARFTSDIARQELGWRPVEEREAFLDAAVRIYAPRRG
jgi:predicted dehydrogenase/nucleoside-diphosphate-sugar epimerase